MQTTINQTISNVLTAAKAPQTQALQPDIKAWADWLKLETFGDQDLKRMVEIAALYCMAFKSGFRPQWLSILGHTGTGKTHVANRIFAWMAARVDWSFATYQHGVIYWPRMVQDLRAGDAYDQIRDMAKWPVLFLDDIGAERDTTGFASEQLNTLLGQRDGKWTILTSNLGLADIAAIDPRLADRLLRGNEVVDVRTESYSLRKLTKRTGSSLR